jgi:peptide/nickel transport system ATP-binding protein
VDLVIKNPQHPYSRLLISSILTPDVDDRWDDDDQSHTPRADVRRPMLRGCRFADRCPDVMPRCSETVPPLYRTDDRRAAACFLYGDRPAIGGANMDLVLAPTD